MQKYLIWHILLEEFIYLMMSEILTQNKLD